MVGAIDCGRIGFDLMNQQRGFGSNTASRVEGSGQRSRGGYHYTILIPLV
jgi:hypothetical protein